MNCILPSKSIILFNLNKILVSNYTCFYSTEFCHGFHVLFIEVNNINLPPQKLLSLAMKQLTKYFL